MRRVQHGNAILSHTLRPVVGSADDVLYGVPVQRIAQLTGASLVTARRWKRTRQVPEPVRRLLKILVDGELGMIDPKWRAWHIKNGLLCGPDTYTFEPGEVLAIPFQRAQIHAYQREERYSRQPGETPVMWRRSRNELSDRTSAGVPELPAPPLGRTRPK